MQKMVEYCVISYNVLITAQFVMSEVYLLDKFEINAQIFLIIYLLFF